MDEQDDLQEFELNQIFQDEDVERLSGVHIEIEIEDEISLGGN